jgi:hypothetical protein
MKEYAMEAIRLEASAGVSLPTRNTCRELRLMPDSLMMSRSALECSMQPSRGASKLPSQ